MSISPAVLGIFKPDRLRVFLDEIRGIMLSEIPLSTSSERP